MYLKLDYQKKEMKIKEVYCSIILSGKKLERDYLSKKKKKKTIFELSLNSKWPPKIIRGIYNIVAKYYGIQMFLERNTVLYIQCHYGNFENKIYS